MVKRFGFLVGVFTIMASIVTITLYFTKSKMDVLVDYLLISEGLTEDEAKQTTSAFEKMKDMNTIKVEMFAESFMKKDTSEEKVRVNSVVIFVVAAAAIAAADAAIAASSDLASSDPIAFRAAIQKAITAAQVAEIAATFALERASTALKTLDNMEDAAKDEVDEV